MIATRSSEQGTSQRDSGGGSEPEEHCLQTTLSFQGHPYADFLSTFQYTA